MSIAVVGGGNNLSAFAFGWAKAKSIATGRCSVMRYRHDEAPQGYENFDKGAAKKFASTPTGW